MYTEQSRLTRRQRSTLIEHFVVGSTTRATAEVVGGSGDHGDTFFAPAAVDCLQDYELQAIRGGRG